MFRLVVLLAAVALAHSQSTPVSRCTANPGALPTNTHIVGCTSQPCVLPQLRDAVINISFRTPRAIRSMRTLAVAYVPVGAVTMPVPYDLRQHSVTCNYLTNASCPLRAGQNVNYTLRMHIESFFPVGTSVHVEFRVVDQDNSPVFCIRTALRIAPPRNLARENVLVVDDVQEIV